jgi:uncharacterized protein (TIGR02996 family)
MSTSLTDDDRGFIRAILDVPDELTTWLIYADWLDERADPRAEFLRLSTARKQARDGDPVVKAIEDRLTALRSELDPNWILVFDTARLVNCRGSGWRFVCPLTWDQLSPTNEPDIRICHTCRSPVFFCHSVEEARQFTTSGQCVALSSRIPPGELPQEEPEYVTIGLIANLEDDPDDESHDDEAPYGASTPVPAPPPRRRPWWKFW